MALLGYWASTIKLFALGIKRNEKNVNLVLGFIVQLVSSHFNSEGLIWEFGVSVKIAGRPSGSGGWSAVLSTPRSPVRFPHTGQ